MKNLLFQNKNHGLPQRMLCTLFIFLISITAAIAQNVTVKGKVVDANGEAHDLSLCLSAGGEAGA